MTLVLLPGPTQSRTLHVGVVLVGTSPRIGFFDANGMLLDTSFQTFVTDASNQACTLEFTLQVANEQLHVQPKQHSPLTTWTSDAGHTKASQSASLADHPEGVGSNFNVIVCASWGDPAAIWIDPTWPLSRGSSGGPKALGAPLESTSYFYLTSLGSSSNPKQIELYVNVDVFEGEAYAWLSNGDGVCVGSSLVLSPPVGSSSRDVVHCQLQLHPGSIASGCSVSAAGQSLPTNANLYYGLASEATSSIELVVSQGGASQTQTLAWYGLTQAPGPVWTNT